MQCVIQADSPVPPLFQIANSLSAVKRIRYRSGVNRYISGGSGSQSARSERSILNALPILLARILPSLIQSMRDLQFSLYVVE